MRLLKTIRVFLRLKWQETFGRIDLETVIHGVMGFLFGTVLFALVWGISACLGRILLHFAPKTIASDGPTWAGFGALIMLIAVSFIGFLVYCVFRNFFEWISDNWSEAKEIVKREGKDA
jgi:hypothetical protein